MDSLKTGSNLPMLEKPSEVIYFYLTELGIPIFPLLAAVCLIFIALLKEDVKSFSEIPITDKINIFILSTLFILFVSISIIYYLYRL